MDSIYRLALILPLLFALASPTLPATASPQALSQNTAEEIYALAAASYARQEWEQASQYFRELIEQHPDDSRAAEAAFYLGESLIQLNQPAEAETVFAEFRQRHPDSIFATRIQFRLAECKYLNNDLSAAETEFQEFMERFGDDPLAEFALPYLGELYLRTGKFDQSHEAYQTALERYPGSSLADKCRLGLAQALERGNNSGQAEQQYRMIADQTQNRLANDARLMLAKSLVANNDWDQASKEIERLLANQPTPELAAEANYLIARHDMTESHWDESWQRFEELLNEPLNDTLRTRVALDAAMVALRINEIDRAAELIDQVKQGEPTPGMLEYAAIVAIDIANRRDDLEELQQLVNQFETDFPESSHLTRCIEPLARKHYDGQKFAEAATRYQQLVDLVTARPELVGNLPAWRYLLGLARIGTAEFAEAVTELETIEDFSGNREFEAATSFAIGTALSAQGKYPAAIPRYRKYLKLMPDGADSIRCQADLALALARNGKLPEAIKTLGPVAARHADDQAVLIASEVVAEASLQAKQLENARKFYDILAASDDPQFASRGTNGLLWAGDQQLLTRENVKAVIESGLDRELACEAIVGQVQKLQAENEHQQSVEILTQLIESSPESKFIPEARVRKAVSLQRLGGEENSRQAIGLFTEFITSQPGHDLHDLAQYELGWAYHDAGEFKPAFQAFEVVADQLTESSYRIDAIYRAAMLARQLDNIPESTRRLQQIINEAPDDELADYARYALAEFATKNKNWDQAMELFRSVLDNPAAPALDNPAKYWLAESLYQDGQVGLAESLFNEIRAVNFDDNQITSAVWLRLAQCAVRKTDWSTVETIVQTRRESPGNQTPEYQLNYLEGRVRMSQAKFDEARYLFSQVLTDDQAMGSQTAAMSQWMMGESWFHQQNYKDALRAYLLVDSLYDYPEWRSLALLQAAKCQLHMGNHEHAMTTCQRMLKTFPDSPHAEQATQLLSELQTATPGQPQELPATWQKKQ